MNFTKWGGRRFLLTLGCGLATTMLVWFGKIGDTVYATVTIATVAAYITGNVYQKRVDATYEPTGAPQ